MDTKPLSYRDRLRQRLTYLSSVHRAAFAAVCADRQYGTYLFASKYDSRLRPQLLRNAIDRCWAFVHGDPVSTEELTQLKKNVDELHPNLEQDMSSFASLILDATAAASYLIETCLTGNVECAAFAGECSRNAVDEWVLGELEASSGDSADQLIATASHEVTRQQAAVDAHPLMVQEMRAQNYALDYLASRATIGIADTEHLRERCGNGTQGNIDLD